MNDKKCPQSTGENVVGWKKMNADILVFLIILVKQDILKDFVKSCTMKK